MADQYQFAVASENLADVRQGLIDILRHTSGYLDDGHHPRQQMLKDTS